jgi:hypothetical protein
MHRYARSLTGSLPGVLLVLAASVAAASPQDPSSGGQSSRPARAQQGPLVLQPISSGFVFTPEVRFTEVNHSYGTMLGGSGGWLYDQTLFIGGGFFGLVDGAHGSELYYGGLITGWSTPISRAVRVGVRGLFGWGHSETFESFSYAGYCHHGGCYPPATEQAWIYQDFWVVEPQATATIRLGKQVALELGGGYRLTGNNYYGWDGHVNGGFGSVGIRFGVF